MGAWLRMRTKSREKSKKLTTAVDQERIMARQSVGSLSNRSACSSMGSLSCSVDTSFVSLGSSSSGGSASYDLESEVGREALREICCSALSRLLDFPDSHLETLLGFDEDDGRREDESSLNVAK